MGKMTRIVLALMLATFTISCAELQAYEEQLKMEELRQKRGQCTQYGVDSFFRKAKENEVAFYNNHYKKCVVINGLVDNFKVTVKKEIVTMIRSKTSGSSIPIFGNIRSNSSRTKTTIKDTTKESPLPYVLVTNVRGNNIVACQFPSLKKASSLNAVKKGEAIDVRGTFNEKVDNMAFFVNCELVKP